MNGHHERRGDGDLADAARDFVKEFKKLVKHLLDCHKPDKGVHFEYRIGLIEPKKEKVHHMIEVTCTNEEKVPITLKPVTKTGKPAKLDGKPNWTVTSGDGTLEVSEDGMTAFVVSPDLPGETLYAVTADADLGSGIVEVADAVKLTVEGALATSLGASAGAAVPKEAPPA